MFFLENKEEVLSLTRSEENVIVVDENAIFVKLILPNGIASTITATTLPPKISKALNSSEQGTYHITHKTKKEEYHVTHRRWSYPISGICSPSYILEKFGMPEYEAILVAKVLNLLLFNVKSFPDLTKYEGHLFDA